MTEVILPIEGKRNILVTSALPYVNNVPHLGNLIGSVLSADVFSRYSKARGNPTLFICGSDEYGTATETKALEEKVTPEELCRKYHQIHSDIYKWFDIKFDIFGRTPTEQQTEIVQDIFRKLWQNGYIEERETLQPFCCDEKHQTFLADRFVEGVCSICGDSGARGDQCDKCGNLLDPFEPEPEVNAQADGDDVAPKATGWLINPRCKVDGTRPEKRSTKHLFLKLDTLKDEVKSWFEDISVKGTWSSNCIQITDSWIQKGLKPRGITRDLKWGVPIPKGLEGLDDEAYANKVFYVWFDACIGYVSITKNYTDGSDLGGKKWEQWWKNPENVELIQFMGKDNVQFHTIIFPASQLGTKEPWTKVHKLSTTEYLQYEGSKFSKSKGVGVFGNNAQATGIASDVWRYYLLSRRPETADSEFKWVEFVDSNNNDLLKNLGNFVNRVITFTAKKYDSKVPLYTNHTDSILTTHITETNSLLAEYISNLEATKLRDGLKTALRISSLGNSLLQDNKLDNRLFTEEPDRCAAVIGLALNHINLLANIIYPFMPSTSAGIFAQLGKSAGEEATTTTTATTTIDVANTTNPQITETFITDALRPGHVLGTPQLLFSQIPGAKIEEWREAYGGEEVRRLKEEAVRKAAEKKAAKERDKARKAARKAEAKVTAAATAATAAAAGTTIDNAPSGTSGSVEAAEKKEEADPVIEKVTDALGKVDVHTS